MKKYEKLLRESFFVFLSVDEINSLISPGIKNQRAKKDLRFVILTVLFLNFVVLIFKLVKYYFRKSKCKLYQPRKIYRTSNLKIEKANLLSILSSHSVGVREFVRTSFSFHDKEPKFEWKNDTSKNEKKFHVSCFL